MFEESSNYDQPEKPSRLPLALWLMLIAFCGSMSGLLILQARVFGANDGSRWDTVWSLINGHGYVIDDAPYRTCDKVMKDGHFYSSKPAFLATAVAAVAWFLRPICGDLPTGEPSLLLPVTLAMINVLPLACLLICYYGYLCAHNFSYYTVLYCSCAAAFGTFLTSYVITLNNHVVAAYCAFFALHYYLKITESAGVAWRHFTLCGLFSALAAVNELHGGEFPVLLFLFLWLRRPRLALMATLPGIILIGFLALAANYAAYGSVCPFYLLRQYYHYPGSYWDHTVGIDAAHEGKPWYLFNLLAGHHGVFSHSPVLILAVLGLLIARGQSDLRWMAAICAATTFGFIVFATHNYGGVCQGPRWTFWLIPFALLGLPWYLEAKRDSRWVRIGAFLALEVSLVSVIFAVLDPHGPWSTSWIHLAFRWLGLVTY